MDLSLAKQAWENLASCEYRLQLLTDLAPLRIGLREVEEYNLALCEKFKSKAFKENPEMNEKKVVKEAMSLKLRDERKLICELIREKNLWRRRIMDKFGDRTRRTRRIFKELRQEALKIKEDYSNKYSKKIVHLKSIYQETEEDKLDKIPADLEIYANLGVFSNEKYKNIETDNFEITVVGEVPLTRDEKSVLRNTPKVCCCAEIR